MVSSCIGLIALKPLASRIAYQVAGKRAGLDKFCGGGGRFETLRWKEEAVLVVLVMLKRLLDELFKFFYPKRSKITKLQSHRSSRKSARSMLTFLLLGADEGGELLALFLVHFVGGQSLLHGQVSGRVVKI